MTPGFCYKEECGLQEPNYRVMGFASHKHPVSDSLSRAFSSLLEESYYKSSVVSVLPKTVCKDFYKLTRCAQGEGSPCGLSSARLPGGLTQKWFLCYDRRHCPFFLDFWPRLSVCLFHWKQSHNCHRRRCSSILTRTLKGIHTHICIQGVSLDAYIYIHICGHLPSILFIYTQRMNVLRIPHNVEGNCVSLILFQAKKFAMTFRSIGICT